MKKIVKNLAHRFGYDILHVPTDPFVRQQRDKWAAHNINLVFDVGANVGQFGQRMRKWGYTGEIVSFEPMPVAFAALSQQAEQDHKWQVVNTALGAFDGETTLHISQNSYSSSILNIMPTHVQSAPDSVYVQEEVISVRKLDSIIDEYYRPGHGLYVKIDTQGYERQVLEGGLGSLDKISGFQMELSLTQLYEGETLMHEMIALLKEYGFLLHLIEGGHLDYETGELLQVEGYFFRSDRLVGK